MYRWWLPSQLTVFDLHTKEEEVKRKSSFSSLIVEVFPSRTFSFWHVANSELQTNNRKQLHTPKKQKCINTVSLLATSGLWFSGPRVRQRKVCSSNGGVVWVTSPHKPKVGNPIPPNGALSLILYTATWLNPLPVPTIHTQPLPFPDCVYYRL